MKVESTPAAAQSYRKVILPVSLGVGLVFCCVNCRDDPAFKHLANHNESRYNITTVLFKFE